MKVESRSGKPERDILIGMVMDKTVCGRVCSLKDPEMLFGTRYGRLVATWAAEHFRKYHKPPGRAIEGYFDKYASNGADPDVVRTVERFLRGLSDEYDREGITPDVLLDRAAEHFNKVRQRELVEQVQGLLEQGEVEKADGLLQSYRRVELGQGAGVKLLSDMSAIKKAFQSQQEVVMRWGQPALDAFFQDSLERDGFLAFEGPDKSGKSFFLQELAWLAMTQKRNVAFFEVGDQSQDQLIRRFGARATGRPFRKDSRVRIPVSLEPGDDFPKIEFEEKSFEEPMSWKEAGRAMKVVGEQYGPDRLRISVHSNSSVSAVGVESVLDRWADDSWLPSLIVIDYADILAAINGKEETREQINATWKYLRRLSQKFHCLLVTATQSDAGAYSAEVLTRKNFSEDKRKNSHVTGMIGINQTATEKDHQLYRLNWIVGRDLEFSEKKCVYVASCLAIANPCVLSCF